VAVCVVLFAVAKVMIDRHPLLAGDLLSYMSIIRGAVVDAPVNRVYQYDQQFRLRIAYNQTRFFISCEDECICKHQL
jgi:hypothetical protein